jgi:hypothetical protein
MAKANRVHSTPRRTASKGATDQKIHAIPAAGPAAEPIWAAIEKHRQERAAFHKEVREKYAVADIPDGATDAMLAAGRLLFTTRPTMLAGATAVLRYVGSQGGQRRSRRRYLPHVSF